jgi:hypothetical protein
VFAPGIIVKPIASSARGGREKLCRGASVIHPRRERACSTQRLLIHARREPERLTVLFPPTPRRAENRQFKCLLYRSRQEFRQSSGLHKGFRLGGKGSRLRVQNLEEKDASFEKTFRPCAKE